MLYRLQTDRDAQTRHLAAEQRIAGDTNRERGGEQPPRGITRGPRRAERTVRLKARDFESALYHKVFLPREGWRRVDDEPCTNR